jgi:peptidyl-prolyl cis-trans isomerase D
MLDALRNASKTWVAFLFIGLLVLSFGVWGIQDFLGVSGSSEIVRVGDKPIEIAEFSRQYRYEKRRLEERTGQKITARQARDLRLHEQALQSLIDKTAVRLRAENLGLSVTDAAVTAVIKSQRGLTDVSGEIDMMRLESVARDNGMTVQALLESIRDDLLREQLTNAVVTGVAAPAGLLGALNHVRRERRVVEYLIIDPSRAGDIKDPAGPDLEKFYKTNAARFERPETRALTMLPFSPKEMAKGIEVKEEDIKKIYEIRRDSYVVKQKRRLEQIRFKDEAAARDGAARLAKGEGFEAVALAQGMKPAEIKIGEAFEGDKSVPAEAFTTELNIPTAPVKGPFGWVILRATEITPGSVKTLDDVRQEIRDAFALEKAKAQILELTGQVDDVLGSGASLEEAAKKVNLPLVAVAALTRDGKDAAGAVVDGLPKDPAFLDEVFAGELGRESTVNADGDGGYYVFRLDKITPAALPALDTIRDQVLAAWRTQETDARLRKLAQDLAARGEKGESMKTLGASLGAAPLTSPGLTRQAPNDVFSQAFLETLFAANIGKFVTGPVGNGQSYLLARFERVDISNDPVEAQITPIFNERIRQSLATDIASLSTKAARDWAGVGPINAARFKSAVDQN